MSDRYNPPEDWNADDTPPAGRRVDDEAPDSVEDTRPNIGEVEKESGGYEGDPFAPMGAWDNFHVSSSEAPDPLPPEDIPDIEWSRPDPERLRSGKARDRIQQRHARPAVGQTGGLGRIPSARGIRQVLPSQRLRLPKMKLPVNRLGLYLIASVAFVAFAVFFLGRVRNNPDAISPNALWIGTEWTYEAPTQEAVAGLVSRLRAAQIGTVYAWVSWLQPDNTWRGADNFPAVQAFVQQFKALYPEAQLLGWVSLPNNVGDGYRLDDSGVQASIAEFSRRVVEEFGFEGVFLNIEPVWDDDQQFLSLLRTVRASVGTEVFISAAIPPDWSPIGVDIPVPPLIVPGTVWNNRYKESVALLIDEMALMAYNSGLSSPEDYSTWVAYQVETFARSLSGLGVGTHLMVGLPTYDAELPAHDPNVETIPAAVQGIRRGYEALGEDSLFVRGTAIFAEYTTDDAEWAAYQQYWVNNAP